MLDEGQSYTCCQKATQEELESDPEAFDCENCEFVRRRDDLSPAGEAAIRTYELLQTSVVRDLKLTPLVFDALQLHLSQAEALLHLELLDVIHQHRRRPVATEGEGDE